MPKLTFISVGQNFVLAHLQKQETTSLCQRGAALCTRHTEGHRDPCVDIVGKTGVEVFGGSWVQFCLSASWITDRTKGLQGEWGEYICACRKLLGFGCPCNVEEFAVTLSAVVSPCAGLALMQFVEAVANLVTSMPVGAESALSCPCATKPLQ